MDAIQARDALMQSIRAFFRAEGFGEVETPLVLKTPCMELHIDAIPSGDGFFRTSPELSHKKLLAQGAEKIFEIGKCFRQGEKGRLHNPEYTMLEWYRAHSDYNTALADMQSLLSNVWRKGTPGEVTGPTERTGYVGRVTSPGDWKIFSVEEAFEEFAGWNPVEEFDADRFDLDLKRWSLRFRKIARWY